MTPLMRELWDEILAETRALQREAPDVLGARFLYSPQSTLEQNNGLLVVGMNPGREEDMTDRPYPPDGKNAFLTERWTGSSYQSTVVEFLEFIAFELDLGVGEEPFQNTLMSNYLPFRTRSYDALSAGVRARAERFADALWRRILRAANIRAIVAMGAPASAAFRRLAAVPVVSLTHPSRPWLREELYRRVEPAIATLRSAGFGA